MTEREEIQMCLRCPLPDCVNCLDPSGMYGRRWFKRETRKQRVQELAAAGMTDKQIAAMLSIHPNTVAATRAELGIPPKKGGRHGKQQGV